MLRRAREVGSLPWVRHKCETVKQTWMMTSKMAFDLMAMASNLRGMASNLRAMASNPIVMGSNPRAMVSNLRAMASSLIAMQPPTCKGLQPNSDGLQPTSKISLDVFLATFAQMIHLHLAMTQPEELSPLGPVLLHETIF